MLVVEVSAFQVMCRLYISSSSGEVASTRPSVSFQLILATKPSRPVLSMKGITNCPAKLSSSLKR